MDVGEDQDGCVLVFRGSDSAMECWSSVANCSGTSVLERHQRLERWNQKHYENENATRGKDD